MAPITPRNTITPDHLKMHLRLVDQVAAAAPPPAEWVALRERFEGFAKLGDSAPMRTRLTAAVVNGSSDDVDLELLRAAAIAEQFGPETAGRVTSGVKKAVLAAMVAAYGEVAAVNYAAVGEQFDTAAKQFGEAVAVIDPEADSAALIGANEKIRKAWLAGEVAADTLTKLLPVLAAAAALCGVAHTERDTVRLSLTVDARDLHRRRVWECWGADGRCGRWSALHKLGARIRACPLAEHQEYRAARPLEQRERFITRGVGELYTFDPEDAAAGQTAADTGALTP